MPYEYRKLSPQEREEIVEYRRAHGYPLHAPPHPFRGAGTYLISAANFEHRAIMSSPERQTQFETCPLSSIKEIAEEITGWVILPNHYHMLLAVQSLDAVSETLKHLHGKTSREWNIEDNLTGKRRVWYKFANMFIRNEVHLQTMFNYIHYNPVKHGYVDDHMIGHGQAFDFITKIKAQPGFRNNGIPMSCLLILERVGMMISATTEVVTTKS